MNNYSAAHGRSIYQLHNKPYVLLPSYNLFLHSPCSSFVSYLLVSSFFVSFFITSYFCLVNAACWAHRKFMLKTYQNYGFVQLFPWEFASLLRRLLLVHLIN